MSRAIALTGFATAIDVACSNQAFLYLSVTSYTIVKTSVPVWILAFSVCLGLRKAEMRIVLVLLAIIGGIAITYVHPSESGAAESRPDALPTAGERDNATGRASDESFYDGSTDDGRTADASASGGGTAGGASGMAGDGYDGEDSSAVGLRVLGFGLVLSASLSAGFRWACSQLLLSGRGGAQGGVSGGVDGGGSYQPPAARSGGGGGGSGGGSGNGGSGNGGSGNGGARTGAAADGNGYGGCQSADGAATTLGEADMSSFAGSVPTEAEMRALAPLGEEASEEEEEEVSGRSEPRSPDAVGGCSASELLPSHGGSLSSSPVQRPQQQQQRAGSSVVINGRGSGNGTAGLGGNAATAPSSPPDVLHPYSLVFGTSLCGLLLLVPCAVLIEWQTLLEYNETYFAPDPWLGVECLAFSFVGGILAFALLSAELRVVALSSGLSLSVAGVFKEVLTVLASSVFLGESLTLDKALGLTLCVIGLGVYVAMTHSENSKQH